MTPNNTETVPSIVVSTVFANVLPSKQEQQNQQSKLQQFVTEWFNQTNQVTSDDLVDQKDMEVELTSSSSAHCIQDDGSFQLSGLMEPEELATATTTDDKEDDSVNLAGRTVEYLCQPATPTTPPFQTWQLLPLSSTTAALQRVTTAQELYCESWIKISCVAKPNKASVNCTPKQHGEKEDGPLGVKSNNTNGGWRHSATVAVPKTVPNNLATINAVQPAFSTLNSLVMNSAINPSPGKHTEAENATDFDMANSSAISSAINPSTVPTSSNNNAPPDFGLFPSTNDSGPEPGDP